MPVIILHTHMLLGNRVPSAKYCHCRRLWDGSVSLAGLVIGTEDLWNLNPIRISSNSVNHEKKD